MFYISIIFELDEVLVKLLLNSRCFKGTGTPFWINRRDDYLNQTGVIGSG
jgi:hypothetical protein